MKSHIFVSYAKEDKNIAENFVRFLRESSFDVFWDGDLGMSDNYQPILQDKLESAAKIIVLWTKNTTQGSGYVLGEALYAFENNKLANIQLDDVRIPVPFQSRQITKLYRWNPEQITKEFADFLITLASDVNNERLPNIRYDTVQYDKIGNRSAYWFIILIAYIACSVTLGPTSIGFDLLIIPLAAFMGARYGDFGHRALAIGAIPFLVTISFAGFVFGSAPQLGYAFGFYFASLFISRLFGSVGFRERILNHTGLTLAQVLLITICLNVYVIYCGSFGEADLLISTNGYYLFIMICFSLGLSAVNPLSILFPIVAMSLIGGFLTAHSGGLSPSIVGFQIASALYQPASIVDPMLAFVLGRFIRSAAVGEAGHDAKSVSGFCTLATLAMLAFLAAKITVVQQSTGISYHFVSEIGLFVVAICVPYLLGLGGVALCMLFLMVGDGLIWAPFLLDELTLPALAEEYILMGWDISTLRGYDFVVSWNSVKGIISSYTAFSEGIALHFMDYLLPVIGYLARQFFPIAKWEIDRGKAKEIRGKFPMLKLDPIKLAWMIWTSCLLILGILWHLV